MKVVSGDRVGSDGVERVVTSDDSDDSLPAIGERVLLLHGPQTQSPDARLSGSDIDCAVRSIDPNWPLRLAGRWRLCQRLHYDFFAWYWILERDGEVVAYDTIDDPRGLGRDTVRTDALFEDRDDPSVPPDDAIRAAYLTVKRVRKRMPDPDEWARIGELAQKDPGAFDVALRTVCGDRIAALLSPHALSGSPPPTGVAARANALRYVRRFGSPARVARAFSVAARRYVDRIGHPTGLTVMIVGPDGSGKSSLAERIPGLCAGMFKREARYHWRPGILPRPGGVVGRAPSDPSTPHLRVPHGPIVSVGLLLYYWVDFVLGDWLVYFPQRVRTGLVVVERGWWDLAVDPARYRLRVSDRLVRALGSALRRPDLTLVLEGDPEALLARKSELPRDEMERQIAAWRSALPRSLPWTRLDVLRPLDELCLDVRKHVVELLERRAVARLGAGWVALPARRTRWWLPRGPRAVARAGLSVHEPLSVRARIGWRGATAVASLAGFRALPRSSAPPREVRELLAPHVPRRGTYAVARSNHPGRFVATLLDDAGRCHGVAKVAIGEAARTLDREAENLERLGPLLQAPLRAPKIIGREPGVLVLEPVHRIPRRHPWELEEEVAAALGAFFRNGQAGADPPQRGPGHGDLAPWNLLRTADGWTLIDWESAGTDSEAFHDLSHFVVQAHTLLGRPSGAEVLAGFEGGRGWIARALAAYAEASGISLSQAGPALTSYLRSTSSTVRASTRGERTGIQRRRLLLSRLGG